MSLKSKQKSAAGDARMKTSSIYELEIPLAICIGIGAAYIINKRLVQEYLFVSYEDPHTGLYGKGPADIYFVLTWATLLTFLRTIFNNGVFIPMASVFKIEPQKWMRFSEQCWNLTYYIPSWTVGMYIAYHSPYWLDAKHLWIGYPHFPFTGLLKTYYLVQMGFWLHQMLVLHLEKRRKDHYAMLLHHIVTLALLSGSYLANLVRIGNAILITMDLTDIFLPTAKLLNYLQYRFACDAVFAMFAISWVLTRHILFGYLTYSTAVNLWTIVGWHPETGNFISESSIYMFVGFLISLQMILIYWFSLIIKVALKLVSGKAPAHDDRSD